MSNLYKGPSIDASYQVSVHLAEGFQRRRLIKMWKVDGWRTTDDGCQVMAKAHIAFGKMSYKKLFNNKYLNILLRHIQANVS
jgi:hypothetical protein